MYVGKKEASLTVGNDWIKSCVTFKYLGFVTVKIRTFGEDIETRIAMRK